MFVGVEYVDLPRFLPDLEIDEPTDDDVARAEERMGRPTARHLVIVLKSHGRRHLVVAAAMKVVESDMDIFEDPFNEPAILSELDRIASRSA